MMKQRHLLFLFFFLLCVPGVVNSQTFTRIYTGWWASTNWTFEFNADGTYKRISMGHYGNTEVTGTYTIQHDTLMITTGAENTHGTVNPLYLLDGDNFLVDLELGYDYKNIADGTRIYNSMERFVKYPQAKPGTDEEKKDLATILLAVLEHSTIKPYLHLKENPGHDILFKSYYFLNEKNPLPWDAMDRTMNIVVKDAIPANTKSYIEITMLKIYDRVIRMELVLHGEDITASIWFNQENNGSWRIEDLDISEK